MASQGANSESLCLESVIRGHHVYKRVWSPRIGEQLVLRHEEDNHHDVRAVAIIKDNAVGTMLLLYSAHARAIRAHVIYIAF